MATPPQSTSFQFRSLNPEDNHQPSGGNCFAFSRGIQSTSRLINALSLEPGGAGHHPDQSSITTDRMVNHLDLRLSWESKIKIDSASKECSEAINIGYEFAPPLRYLPTFSLPDLSNLNDEIEIYENPAYSEEDPMEAGS